MKRKINRRTVLLPGLPGEPLPGQPIVELLGDNRVLIENHHGILDYSCSCISVGMRYGSVTVSGSSLYLMCMSAERLVISGNIREIAVLKKGER